VSANLEKMLGIAPKAALGSQLDLLIDMEALHDIRNRMSGLAASRGIERIYGVTLIKGRHPFDLAVHYAGDSCVLEGEPAGVDDRVDAAALVRKMVARLNTRPTLEEFHRDAARQVRAITDYNRVMIYRFLPDGVGEVIAEVTRAGMEPFLGLHYPASDIPVQARALYLRNPFRIIADVPRRSHCPRRALKPSQRSSHLISRRRSRARYLRSTSNICATWVWVPQSRFPSSSRAASGA
jgi:light-regulated signal transduction histidine kinase (bacteriophytochrome)